MKKKEQLKRMRRKRITKGQARDEQGPDVLQSAFMGEQGTRLRPGINVPGEEESPNGGWTGK